MLSAPFVYTDDAYFGKDSYVAIFLKGHVHSVNHMCFICIFMLFIISVISLFGFEGRNLVLIVLVPSYC